jgi:hypothetical protein
MPTRRLGLSVTGGPKWANRRTGGWIDEDGDGRYDVLEVDTRGAFKGPRAYDHTGLPLHFDNQSTSGSASISTRPNRTFFMTRSPCLTTP